VREAILEAQRRLASDGCVTAGRAQGTEVFNKDFEERESRPVLRVLLWADPRVRAERRFLQEHRRPHTSDEELAATLADIKKRDARDTSREIAPLLTREQAAKDGYLIIETTSNAPQQIAQQIVAALNRNTGTY
jgi:cytidylate kinase